MEGIIRHARSLNPNIYIIVTYFVNEGMLKTLRDGKTPLTIEAHEAVAKHYDVPSINLAAEVASQITSGDLTWKKYGGVHPAPFGNALCTKMINELLNRAWSKPAAAKITPHINPPQPLDPLNYEHGQFIDPKNAKIIKGFTLGIPDWKSLKGQKRERFTTLPMLSATEPGSELTLDFEGTTVGAYIVAGPDAGIALASIDNQPPHAVDLFHHFSKGLHYPRTVIFGTDLKPGKHTLILRLSDESKNGGHALRIMQFATN
jgi:hypothetical protein